MVLLAADFAPASDPQGVPHNLDADLPGSRPHLAIPQFIQNVEVTEVIENADYRQAISQGRWKEKSRGNLNMRIWVG